MCQSEFSSGLTLRLHDMDGAVAIAIAFITAIGGVLAALVQRGRKENVRDHAVVLNHLIDVSNKVAEMGQSLSSHISGHGHKTESK